MLIDTHAHIHQHDESEHREIIDRAVDAGVGKIITAGVTVEDSKNVLEMAEHHAEILAGVGVHPTDIVERLTNTDYKELARMAQHPRVVVMSEIGVDHQSRSPNHDWQAEAFHSQIEIARPAGLPIVFHIRENNDDYDADSARSAAVSILKETSAGELGGTAHYFQGRWKFAKELLDLGFHISFAKTLTRINDLEETAINVPAEKMLLETDAYPQTFKKNRQKWTEPRDLPLVLEKLSQLRNVPATELEEVIQQNTETLLGERYAALT